MDDSRTGSKAGGTAIVVSNHGGRQLDGAPSTISKLPKIVEAVGSETEVLFDGGVRSGQASGAGGESGGDHHRDPSQGTVRHHGADRHKTYR